MASPSRVESQALAVTRRTSCPLGARQAEQESDPIDSHPLTNRQACGPCRLKLTSRMSNTCTSSSQIVRLSFKEKRQPASSRRSCGWSLRSG